MTILATDTQELIPGICRRFSQIAGWRLTYIPKTDDHCKTRPALGTDGETTACWTGEVHDGQEVAGFVSLEPGAGHPDIPLVQAIDLAEMVVDMLSRLTSAGRHLETGDHHISTLVQLGMAVPAQEDLAWALSQVLKAAVQLTSSRSAAFFLLNGDTTRLKLRAVHQVRGDQIPLAERDLATSFNDLQALAGVPCAMHREEPGEHAFVPHDTRAALCVAVESQTMPLGTLWVYDRRVREFHDRDRHVLQSVASQIAAVLERVALLRSSEKQDRISRELKVVSDAEPHAHAELISDARYELAARCSSCHEIGGDLCDLIALDTDQVAIAVGDAAGNSIPAAMIMSAVRGALRMHPGNARELPDTMARLNNALYSLTQSQKFMSLCYGIYNASLRTFAYCNAGHPAPLLVRGANCTTLESHGLLLGVMPDAGYSESIAQLEAGDLLVCFTDGISEAHSGAQAMFRPEGIASAVLSSQRGTAQEVLRTVWNRVEMHIAGGEPADDRTLLVLRVK